MHKHIKTAEDKNIVLILNSFIMGGLPQEYGFSDGKTRTVQGIEEDLIKVINAEKRQDTDPLLEKL